MSDGEKFGWAVTYLLGAFVVLLGWLSYALGRHDGFVWGFAGLILVGGVAVLNIFRAVYLAGRRSR